LIDCFVKDDFLSDKTDLMLLDLIDIYSGFLEYLSTRAY